MADKKISELSTLALASIVPGTDTIPVVNGGFTKKATIADIVRAGAPVSSVNGYDGVITLVKSDIGLENVDNTSDANKPVSTAQQMALDLKTTAITLAGSGGADLVGFIQSGTGAVARDMGDKAREIISPPDFDAELDGVADDAVNIQKAIDDLSANGGGVLRGFRGRTARCNSRLILKEGVTLDLEGGKIAFHLGGATDTGLQLRSYSHVFNGEITVTSSGSPGSQAGIHAPILIGPLAGSGGTVASPSADEGVAGWSVRNLKLDTDADGKAAIQVNGGANNGLIENIEVPDSSDIGIVVGIDWGYLGTISSSDIATSRTNFDAGTAYTTHPHNITVRNIKGGALSRTKAGIDSGSTLVRLSGCYNVKVENVAAKQSTYAAVRVTGGDVGFEFAPAAVKPLRMRGIIIDGVVVESTTDSWLIYTDSYADNVAAAVSGSGYSPLIDPLHETDLSIKHVVGKGSGGASVTSGVYLVQLRGGTIEDVEVSGYDNGVLVDEQVYGTKVIRPHTHGNRKHGVLVDHPTLQPQDVEIIDPICYQNGQDGVTTAAGVQIGASYRTKLRGGKFGHRTAASETTQIRAVRVETAATDCEIEGNHTFSVKAGGTAYSLANSSDYGIIKLFRGNTADAAITNKIGGLNIIPTDIVMGPDGTTRGVFIGDRPALSGDTTPSSGTWVAGDRIYYQSPGASDYIGTTCVTGGSPGTWKRFGATTA